MRGLEGPTQFALHWDRRNSLHPVQRAALARHGATRTHNMTEIDCFVPQQRTIQRSFPLWQAVCSIVLLVFIFLVSPISRESPIGSLAESRRLAEFRAKYALAVTSQFTGTHEVHAFAHQGVLAPKTGPLPRGNSTGNFVT